MRKLSVLTTITITFTDEYIRIITINANPWKYIFYRDPTQSDNIIMKYVDVDTMNSLNISILFKFLLSNGCE